MCKRTPRAKQMSYTIKTVISIVIYLKRKLVKFKINREVRERYLCVCIHGLHVINNLFLHKLL